MKNTTILLIFLLCVLGLIIGAHYSEGSESADIPDYYDDANVENSDATVTISLELNKKNESPLDRFLHDPLTFFH